MAHEALFLLLDVTVDVLVVLLVTELSEQIEAVQLVEDLHGRPVALDARHWVLDLQ